MKKAIQIILLVLVLLFLAYKIFFKPEIKIMPKC